MLGDFPTEPLDPEVPLDPDPVAPPEPPVAAGPAAEPGLAVDAEEPAWGTADEGDAADPVTDGDCVPAATLVAVESLVAPPGAFTAAFLPPPPHAASAVMTAMHNTIRRTQLPPHRPNG